MRVLSLLLVLFVLVACAPSPAARFAQQLSSFPNGVVVYNASSQYEGEGVSYTLKEFLLHGRWRRDSFREGRPDQRVLKTDAYYSCVRQNDSWNCSQTLGENIFLVTDRVLAAARAHPDAFTITMGPQRTILQAPADCFLLEGNVSAEYCFSPEGYLVFAEASGAFWGRPFQQRLEATAIQRNVTPAEFSIPQ